VPEVFAQGLNLGMNDGVIVQAQAPVQTGSYGEMNGSAKPETERKADSRRCRKQSNPAGYPRPERQDRATRADENSSSQGEKKAKDTRTN